MNALLFFASITMWGQISTLTPGFVTPELCVGFSITDEDPHEAAVDFHGNSVEFGRGFRGDEFSRSFFVALVDYCGAH